MSDEPAILPRPPRPLIDWRELLPDATHVCVCGLPLFGPHESHKCVLAQGKES